MIPQIDTIWVIYAAAGLTGIIASAAAPDLLKDPS